MDVENSLYLMPCQLLKTGVLNLKTQKNFTMIEAVWKEGIARLEVNKGAFHMHHTL